MNVTKKLKTRVCNLLLTFYKHHANEAKFVMKWKKNGAISVGCNSKIHGNKITKLEDVLSKVAVTLVKIMKRGGLTQEEMLKFFRKVVTQEFSADKEGYYQKENCK